MILSNVLEIWPILYKYEISNWYFIFQKLSYKKKQWRPPSKKEERREKKISKPEEQEGVPQHQHCPPEKRRGDKNPECHEKQQKDVA
jgi:hypothetical protein